MTKRQTTENTSAPSISPEERAEIRRSGGSESHSWNEEIVSRTLATAFAASTLKFDVASEGGPTASLARVTRTSMAAFKPVDEIEAMVVSQCVGLHNGTMTCLHQALEQDQPEVASKLWAQAADLARAMVEMVEALDRRRAPAPKPNPAPGPSWSAPPMYPPTPQAPASDVSAEDVCSLIVPGPGYRGGPYQEADPTG